MQEAWLAHPNKLTWSNLPIRALSIIHTPSLSLHLSMLMHTLGEFKDFRWKHKLYTSNICWKHKSVSYSHSFYFLLSYVTTFYFILICYIKILGLGLSAVSHLYFFYWKSYRSHYASFLIKTRHVNDCPHYGEQQHPSNW